ncbi:MAG: glycogen debranching N-terminal domain-containing protein [Candidatus Methylacidiphilaceae bacterium]
MSDEVAVGRVGLRGSETFRADPDEATFAYAIQTAASLLPLLTLKHGDLFAICDRKGDIVSYRGLAEGLFYRDMRHLSYYYLTLCGESPLLLSSSLRHDNALLTCDLTNPDLVDGEGRLVLQHNLVHIRRSRFLWNGACWERLALRNFDEQVHRIELALHFRVDFADIFEVRGTRRQQRGRKDPARVGTEEVLLRYMGLDGRARATRLRFDPKPLSLSPDSAVFPMELPPRGAGMVFVEIACEEGSAKRSVHHSFFGSFLESRRELREGRRRGAAIVTSQAVFNEAICRSVADLGMLLTETKEGPYPYAGVPWFSTIFGRDALITALQTLWLDPQIARGVLSCLTATQAREEDPRCEAQPGKIVHEIRQGEMAELGEVPFRCYYGSIDATPLFVILAGAYWERTHDRSTMEFLWRAVEGAIFWIDHFGDLDGDGFVEYWPQASGGLVNQGWKDSHDAVFHADGSLAAPPIALCEVQAYVYGARKAAGILARLFGREEFSLRQEAEAEELRRRFDAAFWDPQLGSYVLALDGKKRPCRVRTSNAGHALFSGIAYPERAAILAETLLESRFFSGWGIRTVAASEARYNPMSYHNGSVWPHDNALIAHGLARYGFRKAAARIFEGLFAASTYIDLRRLPELFCGFPRRQGQGPTFYPIACSPQAWATAAPIFLLQSCLGLGFLPSPPTIFFERPVLPPFLQEVTLERLSVGGARVDVSLRRAGEEVVLHVHRREGSIQVTMTS